LKRKGWETHADKNFDELVMNDEVYAYIIKTIVDTIFSFDTETILEIKKGDQHEIIFAFKDVPGDKSNYKNIRELLNGKLKPEALPHYFNLFFANYLLTKIDGNIRMEYLEPGTMAFYFKMGKE